MIKYLHSLRTAANVAFVESWPVIALPMALKTENGEPPQLEPRLVIDALLCLTEDADDSERNPFVAALLKATDTEAVIRDPRIANQKFVSVWSTSDSSAPLSLAELRDEVRAGRAFLYKGAMRPEDRAKRLSDGLHGSPTIYLVKDEAIAGALGVPSFSGEALATSVLQNKVHHSADARMPLLERLLQSPNGGSVDLQQLSANLVKAARKTIAGPAFPENSDEALFRPEGISAALCEGLADHSWQTVRSPLTEHLTERLSVEMLRKLGIEAFDERRVIARMYDLSAAGPLERLLDRLHTSHRDALSELARYLVDDRLFQVLPLHPTRSGALVSLEVDDLFIASGEDVAPTLKAHVRLLTAPSDPIVARHLQSLVATWSSTTMLDVALKYQDPDGVLEAIGHLDDFTPHQARLVLSTPWLPLQGGLFAAPEEVLKLPAEILMRLSRLPRGADLIISVNAIVPRVMNTRGWEKLSPLLPSGEGAIQQMLETLCRNEDALSHLRICGSPEQVRGVVADKLFPDAVCSLWDYLAQNHADVASHFPHLIAGPLAPSRADELLALVSTGDGPNTSVSSEEVDWFYFVLRQAASGQPHVPPEVVNRALLPNRSGKLVPADSLAQNGDALPETHVLSAKLKELFEPSAPPTETSLDGRVVATLASILAPWLDGKTSREVLAFLIAPFALHEDNNLTELFGQLKHPETPEETLDELFSLCKNGVNKIELNWARLSRYTFQRVTSGDELTFNSLTGEPFKAKVQQPGTEIFVDPPSYRFLARRHGSPLTVVRFWALSAETPPAERDKALFGAIKALMTYMFTSQVHKDRFQARFQQAAQETQDLRLAQALLVDLLPPALRQLGVHKLHEGLSAKLAELDRKRQSHASLRIRLETDADLALSVKDAEGTLEQARHDLQTLLEKDEDAQTKVITALRNEITKYQYHADQVLFELAQNADDAYTHRRMAAEAGQSATFRVQLTQGTAITVRHEGRAINQCYIEEDRTKRGWDRDLINMLWVRLFWNGGHLTARRLGSKPRRTSPGGLSSAYLEA